MKIVTILGARPQFVKAAILSKKFSNYDGLEEIIIHTGQHFDKNMSDIFFDEMSILKPKYCLNINGLSHGAMTGQMMIKIEEILLLEKPNWVLVYGDTNSTLAGALTASKLNIKIIHVEAGLRSYNLQMPEEINRILTDRLSTILFCPSDISYKNLINEGYKNIHTSSIKISGDIMEDASIYFKKFATPPDFIDKLTKNFVLVTIHRAENTDNINNLISIFEALNEIAKEELVVLPLHPRTKKFIENNNIQIKNILIVEPVGYLTMIWLIENSNIVITDSGGLQKEAYFFNKFCLTIRSETEWTELVIHGYNVLVGNNKNLILEKYQIYKYKKFIKNHNLYGGGNACNYILNEIIKYK